MKKLRPPAEISSLFYVLEQLAWELDVDRGWVERELRKALATPMLEPELDLDELEGALGFFDDRRRRAKQAALVELALAAAHDRPGELVVARSNEEGVRDVGMRYFPEPELEEVKKSGST